MEMPEIFKESICDMISTAMDEATDAATDLNTALDLAQEERIAETISELKGAIYFLNQAKRVTGQALGWLERWEKDNEDD